MMYALYWLIVLPNKCRSGGQTIKMEMKEEVVVVVVVVVVVGEEELEYWLSDCDKDSLQTAD